MNQPREIKTVWITKYCLTAGILKREMEVYVCPEGRRYARSRGHGLLCVRAGEFFESETEALVDAEKRRKKKIESMKRQIAKLEQMKIKITV